MIRRSASRGLVPAASEAARRLRSRQPIRRSYPDCGFSSKPHPLPPETPPAEDPDPPADDRWPDPAEDFVWQLGPDPDTEGGEG